LEATSKENTLSSWCIYQEKNGHIVFKLKFENASGLVNREECSYKRKSPKQVERDEARSKAWKARPSLASQTSASPVHTPLAAQGAAKNSLPPVPVVRDSFGVTTRSRTRIQDDEVEMIRTDIESPSAVMDFSLPSLDLADSLLNPSAPCYVAAPSSLHDAGLLDVSRMSSQYGDPAASHVSFTDTRSQIDSLDNDTDSTESGSAANDCQSRRCAYGGLDDASGDEHHDFLYWCEKCHFHVCCDCFNKGTHIRHKKLLKRRSMKDYVAVFGFK
jgi:hypothetical protein